MGFTNLGFNRVYYTHSDRKDMLRFLKHLCLFLSLSSDPLLPFNEILV